MLLKTHTSYSLRRCTLDYRLRKLYRTAAAGLSLCPDAGTLLTPHTGDTVTQVPGLSSTLTYAWGAQNMARSHRTHRRAHAPCTCGTHFGYPACGIHFGYPASIQ